MGNSKCRNMLVPKIEIVRPARTTSNEESATKFSAPKVPAKSCNTPNATTKSPQLFGCTTVLAKVLRIDQIIQTLASGTMKPWV